MLVSLKLGDCVAVMRTLPDESVGVVCSDPPYGMEFEGTTQARLDGVVLHDPSVVGGFQDGAGGNPYSRSRVRYGTYKGKSDGVGSGGARIVEMDFKDFHALPSYTGSPNPLCRKCKGSRRGLDRKGFKVCRCPEPDFPNIGAAQGARIAAWHVGWLTEAFRVLQPGGRIKAFSSTRTFHRLGQAMEGVGFEDVRLEAYGYASGFPKNHDVSKAMLRIQDAAASHTRLPTHDEIRIWDGWGTALKPAWEPVLVGWKPLFTRSEEPHG